MELGVVGVADGDAADLEPTRLLLEALNKTPDRETIS